MLRKIISGVLSFAMVISAFTFTSQSAIASNVSNTNPPMMIATVRKIAANSGDTITINKGDSWYYKRDTTGTNWKNNGFLTDSAWVAATTPIGYGYSAADHPLATDLTKGSGSEHIYFQKAFNLDSLDNINSVYLNIDADDSATIYLNGNLIYSKVTSSDVNKDVTDVYPANPKGGSSGDVYISPTNLVVGQNILSVDLKNATLTSSDIYFDMAFGVSTKSSEVEEPDFYRNLIVTPGENQTKLNFGWYSVTTEKIVKYYLDEPYNSTHCIQSGTDGKGFYFNDGNTTTTYKLPLDKSNTVDGIIGVDVAANYTVSFSTDGSAYTQKAAAPGGENARDFGKENRTVLTYKLSELGATGKDFIWVKIGDQTTDSGWGGCIYNLKVSYIDSNNDNIGDFISGIEDSRVQIVKKSDLINNNMPTSTTQNTYKGMTSDAVSGYASNKVSVSVEANTEYAYRIGQISSNKWSDIFYTKTKSGSSEYDFIYVGDAQLGAGSLDKDTEKWVDTMNKAEAKVSDAAFIISAGDQVNTGKNEIEYDSLTSANQLQKIPFAPTIGNHDANDINYTYHYNIPNTTTNGKTGAGTDYYYAYGETLFVNFNGNSQNFAEHENTVTSAIAYFKSINSDKAPKWIIGVMHQDIYGSGQQHSMKTSMVNLRKGMYPIFDRYNFDVVLDGHDHTYTRSYIMNGNNALRDSIKGADNQYVNPNGTLYITANSSSGSKYYPLCPVRGTYADVRNQFNVPSYSKISIKDNTFSIETYRTDTDQIYDECTIAKNATSADITDALEKAKQVSSPTAELTTAISEAENLSGTATAAQKTQAFEKLYNATPRPTIHDGTNIESFTVGDAEATITEVTTYGDKQPDGTYKFDGETLDLSNTLPITGNVNITVPYSTDLTKVVPVVTVSEGATYVFSSQNFTNQVLCTVTSERGNFEHKYTVKFTKANPRNGWVKGKDNIERYYIADSLVTNTEVLISDKEYYIKQDGSKLTNAFSPKGYYYGSDGVRGKYTANTFIPDGRAVNTSGMLIKNCVAKVGNKYYAFAGDGKLIKTGKMTKVGTKYTIASKTGIVTVNAKVGSYITDANGYLYKYTVRTVNKSTYAIDKNYKVVTGTKTYKIGKKTYAIYKGKVSVKKKTHIVKIGKKKYAVNSKGQLLGKTKKVKIDKNYYKVSIAGVVTLIKKK